MEDLKINDSLIPLSMMHNPKRPYVHSSFRQKRYINKFNKDVLSGKISFETISCLCNNKEFSLIASVDRYSMLQKTVICTKCGLILSNPRMTEQQYRIFYTSDVYRNCYESHNFLKKYKSFYNLNYGKIIFDTVCKVKNLENIHSVLEIGAGGGWNLLPFKSEGILVKGYDYSKSLVEMGKGYGLDLVNGSVNDIEGTFDLIIVNHVAEHFSNPIDSLEKIKKHLNPKGIIYIAVPDIKNFSIGQIQNAHTYYFNLATLQYYMSKAGLKMIYSEPAEVIHLASIFSESTENMPNSFLDKNYEYTANIIEKYRYSLENRNFIVKIIAELLSIVGLKELAGKFLIWAKRIVKIGTDSLKHKWKI